MSAGSGRPPVRVGISFGPNLDHMEDFAEAWSRAAAVGFDSLWLQDRDDPVGRSGPASYEGRWKSLASLCEKLGDAELGLFPSFRRVGFLFSMLAKTDSVGAVLPVRTGVAIGEGWAPLPRLPAETSTEPVEQLSWLVSHWPRRAGRVGDEPQPAWPGPRVYVGGLASRALMLAASYGVAWGGALRPDLLERGGRFLNDFCRSLGRPEPNRPDLVSVIAARVTPQAEQIVPRDSWPSRLAAAVPRAVGNLERVSQITSEHVLSGASHVILEPILAPSFTGERKNELLDQVSALGEARRLLRSLS